MSVMKRATAQLRSRGFYFLTVHKGIHGFFCLDERHRKQSGTVVRKTTDEVIQDVQLNTVPKTSEYVCFVAPGTGVGSYSAIRPGGSSITTVLADNIAEASDRLGHELQKPGRTEFYRLWRAGGFRIHYKPHKEV